MTNVTHCHICILKLNRMDRYFEVVADKINMRKWIWVGMDIGVDG